MRVLTKAHGEIEVDDRQKISFPDGILGFEGLKDYVLFDAAQPPFYWLQSLDRVEIAFVLIEPIIFRPDYSPDVNPEELAEIGIASKEDLLVFAIVTIPAEDSKRMTANLQGPLVINRKTRVGRQCISNNPKWGIRHLILEEMKVVRQGTC
jgi:flagellar assembly factor FliW